MKTKWKNLRSLDEPMPRWFAPDHLARIRSLCAAVKRRTGKDAWIDTARADVCFGFIGGDGDVRLPMSCPLFKDVFKRHPFKFDNAFDTWNEESIVYALQLAAVDPKRKAAWANSIETSRKSDERADREKGLDEHIKRAHEETERKYQRHTMGKHYKGRLAVNGLRST